MSMQDFSYQHISESSITLTYQYGGEHFTFNLFLRDGVWIIHPFEGILIGNVEMCSLVMKDLFMNKAFQVMLAKERIPLSELRSSIDFDMIAAPVASRNNREDRFDGDMELLSFIQQHTIDEVIEMEAAVMQGRVEFYQNILQRMFMDGLGPEDSEFQKIQQVTSIYKESIERLSNLNGPHFNFNRRGRL